ncbi:MAG: class I SAM-dependent methyltransferase [Candidatus Aminicenantes bacterium]
MKRREIWLSLALAAVLLSGPSVPAQEIYWQHLKGYDVPYVPTPVEVVDEMLRLVDIKPGDLLYDLGCGDGRIVVAAAKRFGIKAVGIDIDPVRISESNQNAIEAGVTDKVRFIEGDLFETDFRDASVITMYLLTSVNLRLRPKLLAELRPGTRLVSHSFDMGEWEPDNTSVVKTSYDDERHVYFWVVPANVTGRWEWSVMEGTRSRRYTLQVSQKFQEVSGAVTSGDWQLAISDIRLAGDRITFRLDAESEGKMTSFLYEGKAQGNMINGTARQVGNPRAAEFKWKAVRNPLTAVPLDTGEN